MIFCNYGESRPRKIVTAILILSREYAEMQRNVLLLSLKLCFKKKQHPDIHYLDPVPAQGRCHNESGIRERKYLSEHFTPPWGYRVRKKY
jgi:hypothetical protein